MKIGNRVFSQGYNQKSLAREDLSKQLVELKKQQRLLKNSIKELQKKETK